MSIQLIIGLILSASIGFSLGLIGGGSTITVPVLVYIIGVLSVSKRSLNDKER